MLVKTVKLSSKGQITLPAEALKALRAKKGTEFVLVQEADHIVLVKAARVGRRVVDDLEGWERLAEPVFRELWDNPADEVWNEA